MRFSKDIVINFPNNQSIRIGVTDAESLQDCDTQLLEYASDLPLTDCQWEQAKKMLGIFQDPAPIKCDETGVPIDIEKA